MKNFENKIHIGKNCGNVNRSCDELTLVNKLGGLEHDILSLRRLKEKCQEDIGHDINILF